MLLPTVSRSSRRILRSFQVGQFTLTLVVHLRDRDNPFAQLCNPCVQGRGDSSDDALVVLQDGAKPARLTFQGFCLGHHLLSQRIQDRQALCPPAKVLERREHKGKLSLVQLPVRTPV